MRKTFKSEESCLYGRNEDKEAIIEELLSVDHDQENGNGTLQVISVVGIGGMGKTFLTKLVYGDIRVQRWFDVKLWICAATKFDLLKLAKDILVEITMSKSTNCDANISSYDDVVLQLKDHLIGKKLLLVLDDVWNDDRIEWNFLLSHLESGLAGGSKIIVTTRSQSVSSALGAVQCHVLSELSDEQCWSLFAKHAFNGDYCSTNPSYSSGLERIGKEIVRKCHGLPLIAIMLGDLLSSIKEVEEWEKILHNMEACSDYNIFKILKLSHIDLLFHLKLCLAYGIKSPKDYDFVKKKLIISWIQGLIRPKLVDDFRYFHNLDLALCVSQTLFQWPIIGRDHIKVTFEWGITLTNLILEISLVILDQIASPKKPRYALIALIVSLVALVICITELVHKGKRQKIRLRRQGMRFWIHCPSSNDNPYTFIDVFNLVICICQIIFSSIAYSYLCRGANNPIKMCFVPVILIICLASSKLVRKPN